MKRGILEGFLATSLIFSAPLAAGAADYGKQDSAQKAAPVSATSAPTPQILSVEGSVVSADLQSVAPTLKVSGPEGKTLTFLLDPKASTAWQNNQPIPLSQLKAGQRIKVRYASKEGKWWAKSIEVVQSPPPVPPAGQ